MPPPPPFPADIGYPGLRLTISQAEVTSAAERLNDGGATGLDNNLGECQVCPAARGTWQDCTDLKYSHPTKYPVRSIGHGSVVLLQHPGKASGPVSSFRPIVYLTGLRNVLSLIVLR